MKTAVILVSGGIDSCVLAAIAAQECRLAMLHVTYNQLAAKRELQAFNSISQRLHAHMTLVAHMDHFSKIGGSSLVDPSIPVEKADTMTSAVPRTHLPFGTMTMLSAAASWAEIIGADEIHIGAVAHHDVGRLETANLEPSFRTESLMVFEHLLQLAGPVDRDIRVAAPLLHMNRRQIMELAVRTGAPLDATWSCYLGGEKPCGRCWRCDLRTAGFRHLGTEDPLLKASPAATAEDTPTDA